MDEEIKEIFDYFKSDDKNKFGFNQAKILDYEQAKLLLDYITNLQQENEELKDIVLEKDSHIKEMILQKTDYTAVNILEMKLEDYKSRVEKAVEYIKNCPEYLWANVNTKELLNILNGKGSDE